MEIQVMKELNHPNLVNFIEVIIQFIYGSLFLVDWTFKTLCLVLTYTRSLKHTIWYWKFTLWLRTYSVTYSQNLPFGSKPIMTLKTFLKTLKPTLWLWLEIYPIALKTQPLTLKTQPLTLKTYTITLTTYPMNLKHIHGLSIHTL